MSRLIVGTVLPGSCTDRDVRHGRNASDKPADKPLTCAVFNNSVAPPDEINDSQPASTPTPPQRLRFTYGVPSSLTKMVLDKPIFSSRTGTSVHYTPVVNQTHVGSRAGAVTWIDGRSRSRW